MRHKKRRKQRSMDSIHWDHSMKGMAIWSSLGRSASSLKDVVLNEGQYLGVMNGGIRLGVESRVFEHGVEFIFGELVSQRHERVLEFVNFDKAIFIDKHFKCGGNLGIA